MGQLVFQATAGGQVALVGPNPSSNFSLNVPAVNGNLVTTGDTGTVTNTMLASNVYTAPGTIGSVTPNTGAFTTLSASSTVSGTGFSNYLASPPDIGGTTAAAGSFTNLSYTGTLTGGTGVVNLGSGQFYKDASGNVGIGTSSPSSKFVVQAATDQGIWVTNGTYTGTFNPTSLGGIAVGTNGAYPLILATNTTERMRIDSSGNVGIGTTSPSTKLTVATGTDNANALNIQGDTTNNVMTLTNYQMLVGRESGSNGGLTIGTKSQTWGASGAFTAIATNGTERMRIDSSGNLLVGTTSVSTAPATGFAFNPQTSGAYAAIGHTTSAGGGSYFVSFGYNGGVIGTITQAGTTGVLYNVTSDYRLKNDVAPIQNALTTVEALNPVSFTWIDGRKDDGFIAHEIQAVIPNCVTGEKDAVNEDGTPKYQQMDSSGVIPFLVKAIQELNAKVDAQAAEIIALQTKVGA